MTTRGLVGNERTNGDVGSKNGVEGAVRMGEVAMVCWVGKGKGEVACLRCGARCSMAPRVSHGQHCANHHQHKAIILAKEELHVSFLLFYFLFYKPT